MVYGGDPNGFKASREDMRSDKDRQHESMTDLVPWLKYYDALQSSEEETISRFSLPLPEESASTGPALVAGIPRDRLGKIGPFITEDSPKSHKGPFKWAVDFLVADGTPILAMNDETVVEIEDSHEKWGNDQSYANDLNYITIKHSDGTFSQYCHLAKGSARVQLEQEVTTGDELAKVGKTGWTDRDHLHVLVFRGGIITRITNGNSRV
ncbi:MAG: M23 family metallopeptidase [Candidatus Berkelbacteria bacterium]|nr:M23 family metallopeptidase [Candidatus Berkelbacteria bacterium]